MAPSLPHEQAAQPSLEARQDYESVLADVVDWSPKIRPRGILAGDDYIDGKFINAARPLPVRATFTDYPWNGWFLVLR